MISRLFKITPSDSQVTKAVDYAIQLTSVYKGHFDTVGFQPAGKSILELGPGRDFGPQILLTDLGARVSVADRFLSTWDRNFHPRFYRRLREAWGPSDGLDRVIAANGYDGIITCLSNRAEDLGHIPTCSVDFVLSNAVLEHVVDIDRAISELTRITRPNGLHLHQVDFRDHRNFSRPLEYLLRAKLSSDRDIVRRGSTRRPRELEALFVKSGWQQVQRIVSCRADLSYLSNFVPRLRASRSRYRDVPATELEELGIGYFHRVTAPIRDAEWDA